MVEWELSARGGRCPLRDVPSSLWNVASGSCGSQVLRWKTPSGELAFTETYASIQKCVSMSKRLRQHPVCLPHMPAGLTPLVVQCKTSVIHYPGAMCTSARISLRTPHEGFQVTKSGSRGCQWGAPAAMLTKHGNVVGGQSGRDRLEHSTLACCKPVVPRAAPTVRSHQ